MNNTKFKKSKLIRFLTLHNNQGIKIKGYTPQNR